jgi:hypothetical protein
VHYLINKGRLFSLLFLMTGGGELKTGLLSIINYRLKELIIIFKDKGLKIDAF